MPSWDQADNEPTVAAGTTTGERRPYSAPFVTRLTVTDTKNKPPFPTELADAGPS